MKRQRQALFIGCWLVTSLAASACGVIPQPEGDRETVSALEPEPPPGWSEYRAGIPEDLDHEPARTDWMQVHARDDAVACADTPRNAIDHWIESMAMTGNGNQRVLLTEGSGDAAGVLQRWGFKDDAVFGSDHRLHIDRGAGCWRVVEAEVRWYCRRGVGETDRCL